jgi:hypothetical protein
MRAPAAPGVPEHRNDPNDLEPGRISRNEDHRAAPVRLRLGIRDGEDDPKRRALRT